MTPSSHR